MGSGGDEGDEGDKGEGKNNYSLFPILHYSRSHLSHFHRILAQLHIEMV